MGTVAENILEVKRRVSLACSGAKRDPALIVIVAVSKGRTVEQLKQALEGGLTDIAENRVQEAGLKFNALVASQYVIRPKWHMVGHLQTNKAKDAVRIFDLIHSVDSLRLAEEINKQAALIDKIQDILIEVKTSPEAAKSGVKPDEALGLVKNISGLRNINFKGLMTIAPVVSTPEQARPYFRMLRELKDKIYQSLTPDHQPLILSMGMTDDFEAAIEEGSTMLRLGRVIFKEE
jgi:pyridoxal phosphate enzyme (YggS family)